jgi:hypothetical protein
MTQTMYAYVNKWIKNNMSSKGRTWALTGTGNFE